MTATEIDNLFTYHAPSTDQVKRMQVIRDAAKALAFAIQENAPDSADKSASIRKLRESVMTANAAIVLEPSRNSDGVKSLSAG